MTRWELCSLEPSICRERSRTWKSNYWVLGGAEETEDREMSAPWDRQRKETGRSRRGQRGRDSRFCRCFWMPILLIFKINFTCLVARMAKNLPAMHEIWVRFLGREDPLEEEMAPHSSILAWRIPWTEEPGGLQSMGSQRVGHFMEYNLYAVQYTCFTCTVWVLTNTYRHVNTFALKT